MAQVFDAHELLGRLGLDGARRAARSALERACVDAAAAVAEGRAAGQVTIWGGEAITCLPHRNLPMGQDGRQTWRRVVGEHVYSLASGANEAGQPVGIPYGAKARIILLNLVDGAICAQSPAVEVEPSMRAWMQAMGIPLGGMTYRLVSEQARRVGACRLRIQRADEEASGGFAAFVDELQYETDPDSEGPGAPFPSRVLLNREFYDHLAARPVPLDLAAIRQIADNSWALDLYIWLASVLPALAAPVWLSWAAFLTTIDFGYPAPRKVRAKFLEVWSLVKAVYPKADLSVNAEGLLFLPGPPPVES